ncbi:MFS transporter [Stackebrandtia nassauensis]|uniref:Major facilitator superfamily MFS_1 n=1 Tax=Stackebrandtia nassauensis (strain DSM 44728 / CIP 108903 / NRRL B-16338 / NBRC 102104 / LLR-40K-21) TaxID=446470 RepID=D3Q5K8_STANL|nr:MFS transporter [Stackebrandtia nassauensis]ADD46068.1 major facilitator superfamily MFS_1 [Stackebrandtia nassauensis DSM 44728]
MASTTTLPSAAMTPATARAETRHAPLARTIPVFVLTALLATGQMYTAIPLFNAMEASWQVPASAMTWIVSAFAFGYAGGFILFGPLSDRFGHRRVIVTGMAAAGVVTLLTGLAFSMPLAVGLRVLQGLAIGSIPPAIMAYIGTRFAPRQRHVVITSVATSFLASTVLAQVASQLVVASFDWRVVFIGSAVLFGLLALALRWVMLDDAPATGISVRHSYAAIPAVLRTRAIWPVLGAGSLAMGVMVAVYTGIELTGLVHGNGELLGLRASALPIMFALPLLAAPLGRLARRSQIMLGIGLAAAAMVATAVVGSHVVPVAILLAFLVGGLGIVGPASLQTAGDLGGDHRAAASSVAMFIFYVGATVGPMVAAVVAPHGFAALAWTLAAMLALAFALLAPGARRRGHHPPPHF